MFARLKWASQFALNTVFPPLCLACQSVLASSTGGGGQDLCPSCFSSLVFVRPPFCKHCGLPHLIDGIGSGIDQGCVGCGDQPDPQGLDACRAATLYRGSSVEIIKAFKHGDRLELGKRFAQWIALSSQDLIKDADIIIPIPLHWRRLIVRRFNQSAVLAENLSLITEKPWSHDILKRVHFTSSQKDNTAEQRYSNLANAFAINPRRCVENKNILLVDDVKTTGATLASSAKTLKEAGASRVSAVVIAIVPPKIPQYDHSELELDLY